MFGDVSRLLQILMNLVSNAIKFTEEGQVEVCLTRLNERTWIIRAADTGIGIPVEAQGYIFEPFRQVDSSLTRRHAGTGLGLSIVNQLVTLMKGEIMLESEVGQGSIFTVVLPIEAAPDHFYDEDGI
jgi:signal transduction histidine kinase